MASGKLIQTLAMISSETGTRYVYEIPKSPVNIPKIQLKYLEIIEPFRPSWSRRAAIVSGCAFIPSIKDAGSPGMISITENITTLAAIRLSDNEIRRVNAK